MTDKLAIITGHAGAIGAAMAEQFSRLGYRTIGIDCHDADTTDVAINCDLLELANTPDQRSAVSAQLAEVITPTSQITLINNAAVQIVKPVPKMNIDDLSRSLAVNCVAAFALVQMITAIARGQLNTVINISSIHARLSKQQFLAYAVSKSALSGLTRSLSLELGASTRVCEIQPAAIETAMLAEGFDGNPEAFDALKSMHPSNSIGQPEDVAAMALAIAEQPSGFVNGCVINLDGGISNRLHDPA